MSAANDIFPSHQHPNFVQTQWAEGWAYTLIGFAGAARMLTEQRKKMDASVDQIGLAVFYLQRHRVELVIKHALVKLGQAPVDVAKLPHSLEVLWRKLGDAVKANDLKHWQDLDLRYAEFIDAMHRADERSFAYRCPVDRTGTTSQRAPFIDLEALERYADDFENGIAGYTDWLDELERLNREFKDEMVREFMDEA